MDKTEINLTLSCTSVLSSSAKATVFNSFTVTFLDVCRTAVITIPDINPSTMTTYLWPVPVDQYSIYPVTVTSSLNCAPYDYDIVLAPGVPAIVQSGITVNTRGQLSIKAQMTDVA